MRGVHGREPLSRSAIAALAWLAAGCLALAAAGPAGADAQSAHITSVKTFGSSADPAIVVNGTGFGSRPAPYPAYHPEGHFGCPSRPAQGNGYDYLDHLYISDLHAKHASFPVWTAGQSTRDLGILDCVGVIIQSWSSSRIVFRFGNQYGTPHIPDNVYFLSQGDPILVVVNGARFRTRVDFPGP